MKRKMLVMLAIAAAVVLPQETEACTGITLKAADGAYVVARTIEWGGSNLNSQYVVVPRGFVQRSLTPSGTDGMEFTARYGYVGMSVEQKEFVAEGLNEAGLSAGLFYFPGYGAYEAFDAAKKAASISDLQLVPWILGSCKDVEEVKAAVQQVHVIAAYPDASTVHWRFADASGRQLVLEIIDGRPMFYENELGVLTNAPGFTWQLTNLNNYVNLYPGAAPSQMLGALKLSPFGAGSGFLGIPGDITPPSRFVRAAFYQASAPQQATARDAVMQCFHILNNFDIPIGIETDRGKKATDIPSATQWTAVTDVKNRIIYYRTMYDSSIRAFDLRSIDFASVSYRAVPLDRTKEQPVQIVTIS
ncbi:MAG TPA: choloylglycine hydrolase family protein [Candidatus Tidjanibacter gallistercoris]|nr:choloylglycine hydrolase family protein [Candidatus Tidjanibacter gallistercoris]